MLSQAPGATAPGPQETDDVAELSRRLDSLTLFSNELPCGLSQVKVMVRLCSVPGEAPDPTSYLKVDVRKKQLTLSETGGPSQTGGPGSQPREPPARRASAPAPKMFTFDAVFSQDASQVRGFRLHGGRTE